MTAIDSLLACPRCDATLSRSADELGCSACKVSFPERGGVPWLFADPAATMSEWHNRWQLVVAQSQAAAHSLAKASKRVSRESTKQRLQHQRDAHQRYCQQLQDLLQPLALTPNANLESFLALRTRLPTEQGLTSYAANLFRDWCWGDAENAASLTAVTTALGDLQPQRALVLGAGAGRLAYDVHQALKPELTVALDNNPLFASALSRLAAGESVQLIEFPLAPNKASDAAIERVLTSPAAANPGFHAVLADGLRAPFLAGSFDLVVTPWFVDVVDAPPEDVAARVNHLLADDGIWINHGSLAFSGPDPASHLCLDEFIELITESGFSNPASHEQEVAYMDCPQSRHSRREWVVTTRATKTADTVQPKRHQTLPEWIVTGRQAIPLSSQFQAQAMSTRIHAFIMSLIDGKRSLKDMAVVMEEQQLMTKQEAEQAIRGFLIKMYDEAQRGRGY